MSERYQHDTDDDGTPRVVSLVGNPRPGSRTRAAAEATALRLTTYTGLGGPPATLDLAELAPEVFAAERPRVEAALRTLVDASVAVVATPVYKASYTGLLKAFLDLYGPGALAGVVAVPLVVAASPAHAATGGEHLRSLLVELGATVPASGLGVLEADLPRVGDVVDAWLSQDSTLPVATVLPGIASAGVAR